ncbi:hypothetical protein D0T12_34185 [Actinomadura spongiicola]|uniref:Uncharacterized protein n=1 Tax=Actinomadura spongiicola TaxID=2303421 RepID=A0A372G6H7_9ACTN|nr:hypothetical protein [Actinomadura spongiicola]RFS80985.1 hypothetical protein D0T12_34185 [Actinomadura spongiicola]
MTDETALTLRLWTRRTHRFIRWCGRRNHHDRKAMWQLDRLAEALSAKGWRTLRCFHASPPLLLVSPTKHTPATEVLTATKIGHWVYRTRSGILILCADLDHVVAAIERHIWQSLTEGAPDESPWHERHG